MKKEENLKQRPSTKANDFRSRSQSPKAYLGCDTCKLKNNELKKVKSICKLSEFGVNQDKNKFKKPPLEREDKGLKKQKIKLTDLCDDDKKRIIDLIEELSKLAEKNQELKDSLDNALKNRQEQQDYIMKQANLHLEEKNFYINEINEYKNRVETYENELKGKMFQWENYERRKDAEMAYLAKALQKSLKEKNEMNEQMNHLKTCLRHSLESFQRLRAEVIELQRQEQRLRKYKSTACQANLNTGALKEKYHSSEDDSEEEEFMSTCNQDTINAKSSLDIINDKLEYVYQLLKRKSECFAKSNSQKLDIDLSILLKNDKLAREGTSENFQDDDLLKEKNDEEKSGNGHKFLKPFDQCSKTSIQAERILKKIGKPLNLVIKECTQKTEDNNRLSNCKSKDSSGDMEIYSNILQNKIVQKNDLFESTEDRQYDEDRLLEELFYTEHSLNFGLDSIIRLEGKDTPFLDPPFP